jgi:hypothetical protein
MEQTAAAGELGSDPAEVRENGATIDSVRFARLRIQIERVAVLRRRIAQIQISTEILTAKGRFRLERRCCQ